MACASGMMDGSEAAPTLGEESALTLVALLRDRAARHPDERAYVFLTGGERQGEVLTHRALDRRARACAAALANLGVAGKPVLVCAPPGADYVVSFFGALYAGAVAVPANPPEALRLDRTLPRLQAILGDAEVAAALSTGEVLAATREAIDENLPLRSEKWLAVDRIEGGAEDWQVPELAPGDPAFIMYTSGSTAAPRGAVISHANVFHNLRSFPGFRARPPAVFVSWLPFFHDLGLFMGMLYPLHEICPSVVMSPLAFMQRPMRWLEAMSHYRATSTGGPNFALDLCVSRSQPEERARLDLSAWNLALNGSEPVRASTLERFSAAFAVAGFRPETHYPSFGLAEGTAAVTGAADFLPPVILRADRQAMARGRVEEVPEDPRALVCVGLGPVIKDETLAIVDPETGKRCPPGRVGEIWVAGPSISRSYWQQPEKSGRSLGARLPGEEGKRFLRTGDLGFVHGSDLVVSGRLKDLIILHGVNHHPEDLELTMGRAHPSLRPNCGAAFAVDEDGSECLVLVQEVDPQAVDDFEAVFAALRQALGKVHEVAIHAVVLIRPRTLPKTSSGKVRRLYTRERYLEGGLEVLASWRRTETVPAPAVGVEEPGDFLNRLMLLPDTGSRHQLLVSTLRAQTAAVMGLACEQVRLDRPLINLGMGSIMATELAWRVGNELGLELTSMELLKSATLDQIAADLLAQVSEGAAAAETRQAAASIDAGESDGEVFPLSSMQERFWSRRRAEAATVPSTLPMLLRLSGSLQVAALESSLQAIVDRHETLRTTFVERAGEPVQRIAPALRCELPLVDLEALRPAEQEAAALCFAVSLGRVPIDLEQGPVFRVMLFRCSSEEHLFFFLVHHVAFDGWSSNVFLRELEILYRSFLTRQPALMPALPVQYRHFTRWQRRHARREESACYWRQQLRGVSRALPFGAPGARPVARSFRSVREAMTLPEDLSQRLRELGRGRGQTLFTILLAAFKTLLHLATRQEDIAVGSFFFNRDRPELRGLIGNFATVLPLRSRLTSSDTFSELLERVQETVLEAKAHPHVLAERLLAEDQALADGRTSGKHSELSPFRVMFLLQNYQRAAAPELPGLKLSNILVETGRGKHDLIATFFDDEVQIKARWKFDADRFDAAARAGMLAQYGGLLERIVEDPDRQLAELLAARF